MMLNYLHLLAVALAGASGVLADSYKEAYTVPWMPKNSTSVDQSAVYNGTYYLSDRTNAGVHVVNLAGDKQVTLIQGFAGQFFLDGETNTAISGPNGMVVLPDRNELYVGDANGTVRVVDLSTNIITANISFGINTRADEMAYDSHTGTVVVTLPEEMPPQLGVISAAARKITGKITFPSATNGLEQPAFDDVSRQFYVSVPSTKANPGGEIAGVDVSTFKISHAFPLDQCVPAGIVFGHGQQLLVSCSSSQILEFGVAYSQVMDIATGKILANVSGISGSDQVAYDPNAKLYFLSAYENQAGGKKSGALKPEMAVVNATTNSLMQTWPTDILLAHSVAVDHATNQVVVPRKNIGMVVYNLTEASSSSNPSSSPSSSPMPSSSPAGTNAAAQWSASGTLLLGGLALALSFFLG